MTEVSIALATYNGEKYLQQQLDSIASQTVLPNELIASDDCSSDATLEILTNFQRAADFPVKIIKASKNRGVTRNFELALGACSYDLVLISDQDDIWYPKKIERVLQLAAENIDALVLVTDADYVDENLNKSGVTVLEKVVRYAGSPANHIAGACTAIRKPFLDFLLPFPKGNVPQYDVYLHRWAQLFEIKIVSNECLQLWRLHEASATSGNEMHSAELASVSRRYLNSRKVDVREAYLVKAIELQEMEQRLGDKSILILDQSVDHFRDKLNREIRAHIARAALVDEERPARRAYLGLKLMASGGYAYFKGWKSFAKDILR